MVLTRRDLHRHLNGRNTGWRGCGGVFAAAAGVGRVGGERLAVLEARRVMVFVQIRLQGEGLFAALAGVVFGGRVSLQMGAQVGAVRKRFPAGTRVRFLETKQKCIC